MSVAHHSNDDCAEVFVEQDDHGHAAVRAIVDKGLAQLVEWLDLRLQQQEDNLRSFLRAQESVKIEPQVMSQAPGPEQHHRLPPHSATEVASPNPFEAHRHQNIPQMTTERECGASQAALSHSTSRLSSRTSVGSANPRQVWLSSLIGIFDQLDLKGTGSIDLSDLEKACHATGFSDVQALKVLCCFDESENGSINRLEWLHMVAKSARGSDDDMSLLNDFLSSLVRLQHDQGSIYKAGEAKGVRMILRHDSVWRLIWDLIGILLLLYVAVALPFSLGFGSSNTLDGIGMAVDLFFCCDVALNFRTSYLDRDDTVVVDWKRIGKRYLKSWFFLDLIASFPFDLLTMGVLPDLTPARLLKVGKAAKVLKLLRITKMTSIRIMDTETEERLKIQFSSKPFIRVLRTLKLLSIAFLVCHWLACFNSAVDSSALDGYFSGLAQVPNVLQKYIAGMYWAMMTISTVGYGDITPVSDQERVFSMLAMVVGGSLYGFVVGSVTSIVTDMDAHAFAYGERMEVIQSWLDRRMQIPVLLRRRLRTHFERSFYAKTVIDDGSIIDQLSGELRGDAAFFLVDEHVRHHPMVANLSRSALAELVYVLQETPAKAHELIVQRGAPGLGMHIVIEGLARYEEGFKWQPPGAEDTPTEFQHIARGESFGEEIIFGLAEIYTYTVITISDCKFNVIQENSFEEHFKNLPELSAQMYASVVTPVNTSCAVAKGVNESKVPMLSSDKMVVIL